MPDFSSYLESVRRHYEQWWSLYTLTDAEGRSQVKAKGAVFDFGLMVQTIAPKSERMEGDRSETKETIERFTVLEGLRKYAVNHVLLVGRPGSGKSTALARLLLEEALTPSPSPTRRGEQEIGRIPVLVELRYWNDDGVLGLIRSFLRSLPTQVGLMPVEIDRTTLEELLRSNKFLLLIDGLNELPSEAARQDVLRFRRDFPKVAIVFTTRDLSLGRDFGIEKRLEIQPLTETQMKEFVTAYIPEQSEAMLRQLGGRLREFGSTPLLLWMLCGVFRQTGEIPANLGGVFRAFTMGYEERLKGDVAAEIDRRWWAGLLRALAARMMIGDGSVEFRVAIDRAEVEAIFTEFLTGREALAAGAARKGLEDLLRHHLIQANGSQVEFRHQLIQEYYAAEWLLVRVGRLDDATLQQEFLNYLKWTEPVALMLALVEDEDLAVRVVELALDVDLMLGARLAGEVRSNFQKKTVGLVSAREVPDWLKVEMLGKTRSDIAILELFNFVEDASSDLYNSAVKALGEIGSNSAIQKLIKLTKYSSNVRSSALSSLSSIGSKLAIPVLLKAIEDESSNIRSIAATALGEIGSESEILSLLEIIDYSNHNICWSIVDTLGRIGSEKAIPSLFMIMKNVDGHVFLKSISALGRIGSEKAIPDLLKIIENHSREGVFDEDVLAWIADTFGEIGSEKAIPCLLQLIEDSEPYVQLSAADALVKINSEKAIPDLLKKIENFDACVRSFVVHVLGEIGSSEVIPALLKATEDCDSEVRFRVAVALGKIGSEKILPELLRAIEDSSSHVRCGATEALGEIGSEKAISSLLKALNDPNRSVRSSAAYALGEIGSEKAISGLINALNDFEEDEEEVHFLDRSDRDVSGSAAYALGQIGSERAIPDLLKLIKDFDENDSEIDIRIRAAEALGSIGSEDAIDGLLELIEVAIIEKSDDDVWDSAVESLGRIGSKKVVPGLLKVLIKFPTDVCWSVAKALGKFKDDLASHILSDLLTLIPSEPGEAAFLAIRGIQTNCKFYNYEIHQAKLRKADQSSRLAADRPSLDGDRSPQIIVQGDYIAGDKIEGDNYTIDRVGNLNTGTVNIHGNQNGEQ